MIVTFDLLEFDKSVKMSGMTVSEVCEMSGFSRATFYNMRKKFIYTDLKYVISICFVLGRSIYDFVNIV